MRVRALWLAPAVLVLAACSSPSVPAGPVVEERDSSLGPVVSTEFPSGLECDVFDTTYAGGVDCNFAAFQVPAEWGVLAGVMESVSVNGHELALVLFDDGHLCVVADGTKSGGMTCHYPPN